MGKKYSRKEVIFVGKVFNTIDKFNAGDRILRLYNKGYSIKEISLRSGINDEYVKTYIDIKTKIIENGFKNE